MRHTSPSFTDGHGGDQRPGWTRQPFDKPTGLNTSTSNRTRSAPPTPTIEHRYQLLLATIAERVWRFDLQTPIAVDRPLEDMVGTLLRHARLVECNPTNLKAPQSRKGCTCSGMWLSDVLLGTRTEQDRIVREFVRSGFHMSDVRTIEWDPEGQPRRVLTNMMGIVENGWLVGLWGAQRSADASRRLSREPRVLKRNPSEHVLITDHRGRISFTSPTMAEWLGGSALLQPGADVCELVHPEDRATLCEAILSTGRTSGASGPLVRVRFLRADLHYVRRAVVVHHVEGIPGSPMLAVSVFRLPRHHKRSLLAGATEAATAAIRLAAEVRHLNDALTVVNGHAQLALLDTGAESEAATNLRAILDAVQRASDTLHTMGQRLEDGAEVARRTRGANPRKRQTA
ncbi:MAG: hypothetical protein RL721_2193 [Candidatus Eisenbacteria bacterium]